MRGKDAMFLKASHSERDIVEQVKIAFLNLAFNRFREVKEVNIPKLKKADKIKVLGTSEVEKSVHIVSNLNSYYTICSLLLDGDMIGDTEPTNDKVDCEECRSTVKMCKSIEI